jgi:hypothetical protein
MKCVVEKIGDNYDSELLSRLWADSLIELDARRVKWSYENNPYGKACLWLLRDALTDHYCGTCAVLPRIFKINDQEVKVGITADFSIQKQYRYLGPALKLQRSVIGSEEFEFLIGMPNRQSVGVQLRAGFKTLGHLSRYVKVFRLNRLLKEQMKPLLPPSLNIPATVFFRLNTLLARLRLVANSNERGNIYTEFSREFDTLWSIAKKDFSFAGKREHRYLQWRFSENPYVSYHVFALTENGSEDLAGYIVFCVRENISFIDDISAKNTQQVFKSLMMSFIKYCLSQGYDAVSLKLLADDRYINVLRKLGFSKFDTDQKIVIYNRNNKPIRTDRLFLTVGDFDF